MLVSWVALFICVAIYRDIAVPSKIQCENIQNASEEFNYGFSYIGDAQEDTIVNDTQNGEDKVTRFEYISGNGYKDSIVEYDGYIYIPQESVNLFDTSVLIKDCENGDVYKLYTEAQPCEDAIEKKGDTEYNYSYGYFKSVVSKKYILKNVNYQIFLLYGNNKHERCIVETAYCFSLNSNNQVEVKNINEIN